MIPNETQKTFSTAAITVTIKSCARCGGDHYDLVFKEMAESSGEYTHFAMCPELSEPILLRQEP